MKILTKVQSKPIKFTPIKVQVEFTIESKEELQEFKDFTDQTDASVTDNNAESMEHLNDLVINICNKVVDEVS